MTLIVTGGAGQNVNSVRLWKMPWGVGSRSTIGPKVVLSRNLRGRDFCGLELAILRHKAK